MEIMSFFFQLVKAFVTFVRPDSGTVFSSSVLAVLGVSLFGVMLGVLMRLIRR